MTTYHASIAYITGKTITAQPLLAGAVVGSPIGCVAFASDSSVYGVSLTGVGACDQILFYASGVTPSIGGTAINWNGTADVNFSYFNLDSSGRVLLQPSQPSVVIPTVTTATNLTNAPTSGDLTAAMKTSIGTLVGTPQTGDSYLIVHDGTIGNAAIKTAVNSISGGGSGSGANTLTITVKDTSNNLLNNINVYLQNNGSTIAQGITVAGVVSLLCSNGTYTVAAIPLGQLYLPNSSGPTTFSANTAVAIALTPITITAGTPPAVTGYATTLDTSGATAQPNVLVQYRMTALQAGDTGAIVDSTTLTAVSNSSGVLTLTLRIGAAYEIQTPRLNKWLPFTAGATTFPILGGVI